jgi:cytochrome b561
MHTLSSLVGTGGSDLNEARGASTRQAVRGYSTLQIALHWTIALLVFIQLVFNEPIQEAFDARLDGEADGAMGGAMVHVAIGMTILVLAIIRVAARAMRGAPPAHADTPLILRGIGYIVHALLYLFIFAMPITGAIAWFGGVELSGELHEIGRLILIPLIGLHIIGGLAEHFVFRNDTLMRMLKPDRTLTKV